MKTSNERPEIETVLRALSEVDVPTHLGQEVARDLVRSLQTRSAIQPRRPWFSLWNPPMLGTTCAFIVLVLITSFFRSPFRRPEPLPEQAYSQPQLPPAAPKPFRQTLSSGEVTAKVHAEKISSIKRKRSALASPTSINDPAPVAPLSEQEKLLIHIAQKRDPVQLASLNTELQEAMDTARRNNFIRLSNGGSQ